MQATLMTALRHRLCCTSLASFAGLALVMAAPVGLATEGPGSAEPARVEPAAVPESSIEPINAEPPEAEPSEPMLLGDIGGTRPALDKYGISLDLGYISETFGVVHGGVKQGLIYEGQASAGLTFDLKKMLGWPGAKIYANALQIHGRGASRTLLGGNLMTVSNIEALPTTRLYRLYFEQSVLDDRASLRVGQIAADDEFITSDTAANLINGTFGWPDWTGVDVRGGGPAYPLPQLGVRLQVKPVANLVLRGAVFTGNPGGKNCLSGNPQQCDPHGVLFPFSAGTLWIGEAAYSVNSAKGALPGVYKLGGWYETGPFPSQLDPALNKTNNGGVYAVVDQGIWRRPGNEEQVLNFFLRIGGSPADRNLVSFYTDVGFGLRAPFVNRPADVVTLGAAYCHIPGGSSAGSPISTPFYEAMIELSYKAAVAPGWSIQPDLQFQFNPSGNIANPNGSGTVKNAFVLGLRTTLAF